MLRLVIVLREFYYPAEASYLISTLVFSPFKIGHLLAMPLAPFISFARIMMYPATDD